MTGYSYTTISIDTGEEPRITVALHPDASARVAYYPTNSSRPFIDIEHAGARVIIGTGPDAKVTEQHVTFARHLLDAAAAFLADCERLHAEQRAAA
ncbi:hypothetical protein [Nonomuraea indica]|uniref:DUF1876 domain-containing protein n=1 Tax=Nonomuraea indica TaxID=1581193 RepID=A0ABW8A1Z3_9ACTN